MRRTNAESSDTSTAKQRFFDRTWPCIQTVSESAVEFRPWHSFKAGPAHWRLASITRLLPLRRSIEAAVLRRIIDMQIHSIGIDLGKTTFHLVALGASEA